MADTPSNVEEAEIMTKYGIIRVPADQFRYKVYRYSNLRDAVVQARRDQLI